MILTTRCAGCGARGSVLCRTCRFSLIAKPSLEPPDGVVVASAYTGRVRDVLLGCKYHNRRTVSRHLAGVLIRRLLADGDGYVDGVDVVTWAPTTASRRRRRGFDQAELVARAVAFKLGVPCRRLLEREGGVGVSQTGRERVRRLDPSTGPRFRADRRAGGRTVLVVDDVVTTGATLRAAAATLHSAGAAEVITAAVAATPGRPLAGQKVA